MIMCTLTWKLVQMIPLTESNQIRKYKSKYLIYDIGILNQYLGEISLILIVKVLN